MRIFIVCLLVITGATSFAQTEKKMKNNFTFFMADIQKPPTFSFTPKNPDKHGFDVVTNTLNTSFLKRGISVVPDTAHIANHYALIIEYYYGWSIPNYKMQYSNLAGTIVDLNNQSKQVGTFSYKGRYEPDYLAEAIAEKIKITINQ